MAKESGKNSELKKINDTSPDEDLEPIKVEIEQFDQRIRNVEKISETVKEVSDGLLSLGRTYIESKSDIEKREQEFYNTQHKRSTVLLGFALAVIFTLCLTALLQRDSELVKFFINSGLALAAGTGIASLLKAGSGKKKKQTED
jgi:hypothetical protein